jgi:hypothetical protein
VATTISTRSRPRSCGCDEAPNVLTGEVKTEPEQGCVEKTREDESSLADDQ